MRYHEIIDEETPANTLSANLKKQAKKLKKQADVQKKREDIARLSKASSEAGKQLSSLLSNSTSS